MAPSSFGNVILKIWGGNITQPSERPQHLTMKRRKNKNTLIIDSYYGQLCDAHPIILIISKLLPKQKAFRISRATAGPRGLVGYYQITSELIKSNCSAHIGLTETEISISKIDHNETTWSHKHKITYELADPQTNIHKISKMISKIVRGHADWHKPPPNTIQAEQDEEQTRQ